VLVGFLVLGKVEGWGRREYINRRRKRMAIAIVRKRAKFFYLNW
jgi:hypothetical protein